MWELYHKEGWGPKNWFFQIVILEKTLESPLDCEEIKSVNPKGNQPWILIERTDAEAEAPILWLPDVNSWLIGKDPDAGEDWRQKERATGDEMAGWHHQCNEHELRQTLGDGEGQGGLVCCSPWDCKQWTQLGNWKTSVRTLFSFMAMTLGSPENRMCVCVCVCVWVEHAPTHGCSCT